MFEADRTWELTSRRQKVAVCISFLEPHVMHRSLQASGRAGCDAVARLPALMNGVGWVRIVQLHNLRIATRSMDNTSFQSLHLKTAQQRARCTQQCPNQGTQRRLPEAP